MHAGWCLSDHTWCSLEFSGWCIQGVLKNIPLLSSLPNAKSQTVDELGVLMFSARAFLLVDWATVQTCLIEVIVSLYKNAKW